MRRCPRREDYSSLIIHVHYRCVKRREPQAFSTGMVTEDGMLATDPFFARGGAVGCLLLHGLSGNPADLRPLADELARRGYTVDVPLLPGHGPTAEGTGTAGWHAWRRAVGEAHVRLAQSCSHVVLIGHSMGGALAIIEAVRREPAALVLLGVPTFVGDWRARLLPVAKYVVRWWYPLARADFADPFVRARALQGSPEIDLDDPYVQRQIRRSVRIPTGTLDHFFRLIRHARRHIRAVSVPSLILHGRQDSTAIPACAEELYRDLASSVKELAWFEASGHQLVTGPEGAAVIERIASWIVRHAGDRSD